MSKAKNYKLFTLIILLLLSFALLQIGSGLVFGGHKKTLRRFIVIKIMLKAWKI